MRRREFLTLLGGALSLMQLQRTGFDPLWRSFEQYAARYDYKRFELLASYVRFENVREPDRTDPGHDLALGQMPVAHQPRAAVICQLVGMAAHKSRNLGLDRLRQQRSRAIAQNLGQRIGKRSWLGE